MVFRGFALKVSVVFFSVQSLCPLCSVVDEIRAKTYHRVTEDTEIAQRTFRTSAFCAKPFSGALPQKSVVELGGG